MRYVRFLILVLLIISLGINITTTVSAATKATKAAPTQKVVRFSLTGTIVNIGSDNSITVRAKTYSKALVRYIKKNKEITITQDKDTKIFSAVRVRVGKRILLRKKASLEASALKIKEEVSILGKIIPGATPTFVATEIDVITKK